MKIWITEYIDEHTGVLIGPYIKASNMLEASRLAIQHGLFVIGEIHELKHEELLAERTIH